MEIGVEISLYPLQEQYVPDIKDFIGRLQLQPALRVVTNSMSTQVFGPFDTVMDVLRRELHTSFERLAAKAAKAVFVMKVLGPLAPG